MRMRAPGHYGCKENPRAAAVVVCGRGGGVGDAYLPMRAHWCSVRGSAVGVHACMHARTAGRPWVEPIVCVCVCVAVWCIYSFCSVFWYIQRRPLWCVTVCVCVYSFFWGDSSSASCALSRIGLKSNIKVGHMCATTRSTIQKRLASIRGELHTNIYWNPIKSTHLLGTVSVPIGSVFLNIHDNRRKKTEQCILMCIVFFFIQWIIYSAYIIESQSERKSTHTHEYAPIAGDTPNAYINCVGPNCLCWCECCGAASSVNQPIQMIMI